MNTNKKIPINNINYSRATLRLQKFHIIVIFLSGILLLPTQLAKSEEIFLKCTGKFEIDRGELIKPDWETSYLTINLEGLKSTIYDKGIKKEGRTLIRRDSYTITYRDKNKRTKTIYKVHGTQGTYMVDYPQSKRTLIGTCQKGRG